MQAAWYEHFGAAGEVLQVGDLPDPLPGPGEVRVKLFTSGVNPSDVKSRAGLGRPMAGPRVTPQSDGAGVIDQVGDGVATTRLGQRVWTFNAAFLRTNGTAAQYVTLPDFTAPNLPDELDFSAGACLGIPVMTAHRCVFSDGPVRGSTILVTGGAGVVGHYAIQLAKWGGARVIATVSSAEKAQHALAAGADQIIDYRNQSIVEEGKRLAASGFDRIVDVDFGANLLQSLDILKPGGTITSYASAALREPPVPFYRMSAINATFRAVLVYTMPDQAKQAAISDIGRWAREAVPVFAVAAHFDLADIVQAHRMVEDGRKVGHVLLDIPQ